MASESFGCHDISRHWWGASAGWESCCFGLLEGAGPVAVVVAVVVWVHCTRGGCYWTRVGCTLGGWGLRAVRTTLGQWIPTLVEQADSGRLGAEPASNHDHRDPAQMAGRERCRRTREGGAGLYRTNHGLSLLRGPVSTALTLTSLASKRPAGIVGILRFFFIVRRRCACDVSTMDTRSSSQTAPHRPRPHRLQGPSPPHRPRTLEEAARPRRPPCAPRLRGGSGPDGVPASLAVPAGHRARH